MQELLLVRATPEDLVNSKVMNFGGAGAALATILLIAQIGVGKPALVWALALAAAALPMWLALALTYDAWITLKLWIQDLHVSRWLRHIQSYGFWRACYLCLPRLAACCIPCRRLACLCLSSPPWSELRWFSLPFLERCSVYGTSGSSWRCGPFAFIGTYH